MLKQKLPKDWIAVNSKSHPDRVYFFNVKTNQSSWVQPTSDKADKTSSVNKSKIHKEESHRDGATPERNIKEASHHPRSCDKSVETPQMKAIRAKIQQRLDTRSKLSSKTSYTKTVESKKKISSSRSSSSRLRNDKSASQDGDDNEVTLTPQMRSLYEKIEQRLSNVSSLSKTSKEDGKNKQQVLNIMNQKSTTTLDKLEKSTESKKYGLRRSTVRKHDIRPHEKDQDIQELSSQNFSKEKKEKLSLKKNLAKERMQRLRSLNIEKEKFKEMCCADLISKKTLQTCSTPDSSDNNSVGSTCIYVKNKDLRLKRLHNRILKDKIYGRKVTLNEDKSQSQHNNEPIVKNTTKDMLIEQAEEEVLYEEMDWEPMKDEEIALEIEVVRTQLDKNNLVETKYILENNIELTESNKMESREKDPLYIVVDTNVFLSNLEIIEEARDTTFKNYPCPFIVIPWTVICELDYFKDNKSKCELSMKARKAISFIHKQFSSKHPRVIGQTREQAAKNKENFSLDCPDDEILQCCLQIHQLQKSVVLLSYDKNLCTKAMIYHILTLGRHDPLEKIDYLDRNGIMVNRSNNNLIENSLFDEELHLMDNILEDVKLIMRNFLSTIITKQMSEIYGETEWQIYVIIKPPWTIITALKCAIKHWIAAINESFQRRAEYILKELLDAFVHIPDDDRKLQHVEYILEKSNDLVQMVNMDKHCDLTTQTFDTITELKEKCKKHIAVMNLKKLHDKIGIVNNVQEQEMRAEKVFQCFDRIYNYARDICGMACNNAGIAYSFAFQSVNPSLSQVLVQRLQSEITKKVTDLTQNLNKLLVQAEDSMKYQTLFTLQQNLITFLPDTEKMTFDVTPLDIYYCVKLKEEILKTGLRQLQELTSHFCALSAHT